MWSHILKRRSAFFAAMGVLTGGSTIAQTLPAGIQQCTTIASDAERLQCYDQNSGRYSDVKPDRGRDSSSEQGDASALPAAVPEPPTSSRMTKHWELDAASKHRVLTFRPHHENYLIATYNSAPNNAPYRPFRSLNPNAELSHGELAYQLGFKLKLAQNPGNLPLDVWFGYTQRSFWQAGNREASSPFRETDYLPEVMAVVPTNLNLLGMKWRFLNLGLVHQSNGQSSTLSRSWNRVYLQAGLEHGDFQVLVRAWQRIKEKADEDDNPRISDYLGHGDMTGTYHWNGHEFSLLTRYNFGTDRGAARIGWAFPLGERLKGYVQYFSGYGYTLIDYNAYQRVLGLGVMVTY